MSNTGLLLVGCGRHAFETIGPVLVELNLSPSVVCDISEARARSFAAAFCPRAQIETDWQEPLNAGVERIIAAVSAEVHSQIASAALTRGNLVLVEKPLAVDTSAAEDILRQSVASQGAVFVGFNYRFAPAIRVFRDALSQLDEIRYIDVKFFSRNPSVVENPFRNITDSWLYGNGIHVLDLILFLGVKVQAVNAVRVFASEGLIAINALMLLQSGAMLSFSGGNLTPTFELSIEVRDVSGRILRLMDLSRVIWTLGGRNDSAERRRFEVLWGPDASSWKAHHQRGHFEQFRNFLNDLPSPPATVGDALHAMMLADSITSAVASDIGTSVRVGDRLSMDA